MRVLGHDLRKVSNCSWHKRYVHNGQIVWICAERLSPKDFSVRVQIDGQYVCAIRDTFEEAMGAVRPSVIHLIRRIQGIES